MAKQPENTAAGRSLGGKKTIFVIGLVAALVLVAAGVFIGSRGKKPPDPLVIEQSLRSYIQGITKAGKLVVVEARQMLTVTEKTPGLLFGDTRVGRFLGIRSDATVVAVAWADMSFVLDLFAPESWSLRYSPDNGGTVFLPVRRLICSHLQF